MTPEIRDCTAADLDALQRHLPTGPGVHRHHYDQQRAGARTYLTAWAADRPVGTAVICWDGCVAATVRAALPDAVEITTIHVHPEHRGHGIGTALIAAAEQRLTAAGTALSVLSVDADNPRAATLYTRLGYTDTGHRAEITYTYADPDGTGHTATEHTLALSKALAA